ncbi:putative C-S lyase [Rhodobacteraceae bacterium 2CG4]|uniref:cysteine-S-conjugate beta-lyase n=1 Tax=Halovulum marinum TaxID=2662447 RepID=A0A6L5YV39_9RHOB|nr:PatB family C-S lyase [Halovulum marinum]MSU88151.1 putative C-S lyase [Halovulum marinum]
MTFDFDRPIDRRRTNTSKWDNMLAATGVSPDDGLAMWVADMDFEAPPAVNATLRALAEHGVHGYFGDDRAYRAAVTGWLESRHGWHTQPDWVLSAPGLVSAVAMCLQGLTAPGDGVVLFTPVYHAFHRIVAANDRRVVQSELALEDGRYRMDLDALAAQLDGSERMLILCSPHNPGGRVWSGDELRALGAFCVRHDLLLLSDEVHMDLVYPGHRHRMTALAVPGIEDRLITLVGPAKTFGINGALIGQIVIEHAPLRRKVAHALSAAGLGLNRAAAMMCTAAFAHGADWLDALIPYLDDNRRTFEQRVNALPGIRCMPLDATYLAWVDFSVTGMTREEFTRRVKEEARIAVNEGPSFGKGGENWLRFNLGTRRGLVDDALERLEHAFADLR